jgi:hypothetical protein
MPDTLEKEEKGTSLSSPLHALHTVIFLPECSVELLEYVKCDFGLVPHHTVFHQAFLTLPLSLPILISLSLSHFLQRTPP